jgi:NADPH:quinone reductase
MRAVWYDRQGPAAEVLQVGELPDPQPGPGKVRVRVRLSGVNPGDTKKRRGWLGSSMPYPRVIPHSDAAGVVDAVGEGVDPSRTGRRVWVHGAQSYRAFGTAAQYTVVPEALAVDLPDAVSDEVGACLGIPGITAHRAVFGDGPVTGATVLVHGVLGGVGALAAQLATWGGARVIGTVRRSGDLGRVPEQAVAHAVALDRPDPAAAIRDLAPSGVDRIVEVSLSDNADLDVAVARVGTVIAAYATRDDRPSLPFWPMLFNNVTIRLLGSDDFPAAAKQQAAADLTTAARDGALRIAVGQPFPLASAAEAHERVDAGSHERVLLAIND